MSALKRYSIKKALNEYDDDLNQVLLLVAKNQPYGQKLNKILEFYNNDRSHDFDEGKLRTQLKYFSANLPKKETLILDDIINYFQELEPSCKNLCSEVGKIIELILMLSALAKEFVLRQISLM